MSEYAMTPAAPATDPRSILSLLSLLPNGQSSGALTFDELGKYLAENYGTEAEKDRNKRHALRDELYRDGGCNYMRSVIDEIFRDPTVRELRKKWVKHARYNNALKRVVNELSTVYAEPAKRSVKGGTNDTYQKLLEAVHVDEMMLHMSRLLNLHRALLVGFRVRVKPDGTREPVLAIATPAIVRAVTHPNDDTLVIGWMIRTCYKTARKTAVDQPAWTLWTDFESMQLRDDLTVIGSTYQTHMLGVIPWVPVTLTPPAAGFWPGEDGEDLVAAHTSIWFINVLTLKETKSATQVPVISGDGTNMARGQAADSEVPLELADGQSLDTVDMSMDTKGFRDTSDHVLEHAGQNYGMSGPVMNHQGVQSAEARELMRAPLNELRKHEQTPLRRFELALAVVMSAVCKVDLPTMNFDTDGWRVEFGTPVTPLAPSDDHNLFVARRAAGLTNTVEQMTKLHPGMSAAEAQLQIETNYEIEATRAELARPVNLANGASAPGAPPGMPGAPPNPAAEGDVVPIVPPEAKVSMRDQKDS